MPPIPILPTVQNFIQKSPYVSLEITFATHWVLNSHCNLPIHQVLKQNSRLVINKSPKKGLATMVVVDNLVFNFSFRFVPPTDKAFHLGAMLHLPRPLDQGHLHMDADQLTLSFRIDAPDPKLRIYVSQTYSHIQNLERFPLPYVIQEDSK